MGMHPCHSLLQCYVADSKLYQRSADTFLGVFDGDSRPHIDYIHHAAMHDSVFSRACGSHALGRKASGSVHNVQAR